jgi:hypothetical protein
MLVAWLAKMGFADAAANSALLRQFSNDLAQVVDHLTAASGDGAYSNMDDAISQRLAEDESSQRESSEVTEFAADKAHFVSKGLSADSKVCLGYDLETSTADLKSAHKLAAERKKKAKAYEKRAAANSFIWEWLQKPEAAPDGAVKSGTCEEEEEEGRNPGSVDYDADDDADFQGGPTSRPRAPTPRAQGWHAVCADAQLLSARRLRVDRRACGR